MTVYAVQNEILRGLAIDHAGSQSSLARAKVQSRAWALILILTQVQEHAVHVKLSRWWEVLLPTKL